MVIKLGWIKAVGSESLVVIAARVFDVHIIYALFLTLLRKKKLDIE